jgi:hypothetical protein
LDRVRVQDTTVAIDRRHRFRVAASRFRRCAKSNRACNIVVVMRFNATRLVAVAVAVAVAAAPRVADACSCVRPVMSRVVLPTDGANDVPLDAHVRVFLTAFAPELRAAVAKDELRLRRADGALVPSKTKVVATRVDLVPDKPLVANTRYQLEQLVAFDGEGQRMSDTQRWHDAGGWGKVKGKVVAAWYPVSSFRTGASPDSTSLPTRVFAKASVRKARGGGDCGPGEALSLELEPLKLPPLASYELEVRGQGVVATVAPEAMRRNSLYASNMLCAYDKVYFRPRRPLQVRAVLRGASGRSEASPWMTPTGGTVPHRQAPKLGADVLARWKAVTLLHDPKALAQQPLHCPYGVETLRMRSLASGGAGWAYESLASLGLRRGALVGVTQAGNGSPQLERLGKPAKALPLSGVAPRGWFDDHGTLLTTTSYANNRSEVLVARIDSNTGIRWSRVLRAPGGRDANARVVAGGGHALAAWHHTDPKDYETSLCWATLDDASGRTLASNAKRCIDTTEGYPALARVGDRFLLAHHRRTGGFGYRGKLELLHGTASRGLGRPKPLDLGTKRGGLDMAVAGREIGIVGEKDGRIVWANIASDGRILRGPITVSQGRGNRKPRIAWGHGVFLVGWEQHPHDRTYVTVVDRFGTAAPVHEVLRGSPSSTVALVALAKGFAASASVRRHELAVDRLRCRKAHSPRAPDRILMP